MPFHDEDANYYVFWAKDFRFGMLVGMDAIKTESFYELYYLCRAHIIWYNVTQ